MGVAVQDIPLCGEPVLSPDTLDVNETELALAVEEMLQGADRNQLVL
jgi:hypothetical protein